MNHTPPIRRRERDQRSPVDVSRFSYGESNGASPSPSSHFTPVPRTDDVISKPSAVAGPLRGGKPPQMDQQERQNQRNHNYSSPASVKQAPSKGCRPTLATQASVSSLEPPAPPPRQMTPSSVSKRRIQAPSSSSRNSMLRQDDVESSSSEEICFYDNNGDERSLDDCDKRLLPPHLACAGRDDSARRRGADHIPSDTSRNIHDRETFTDQSTGWHHDPPISSFADERVDQRYESQNQNGHKHDSLSAAIAANIAEQEYYEKQQKLKEEQKKAATKREPSSMSLSSHNRSNTNTKRQSTRMSESRVDLPQKFSFQSSEVLEPPELVANESGTGAPLSATTSASKLCLAPPESASFNSNRPARQEKLKAAMGAMGSSRRLREPVARKPPPATHSLGRSSAAGIANMNPHSIDFVPEDKPKDDGAHNTIAASYQSSNVSIERDEVSESDDSIQRFHQGNLPKLESFNSGIDLDPETMNLIVSRSNELAARRKNGLPPPESVGLCEDPEKRAELEARRAAHNSMARKPTAKELSSTEPNQSSLSNITPLPSTNLEWRDSSDSGLDLDEKTLQAIVSNSARQAARRRESTTATSRQASATKDGERISRGPNVSLASPLPTTTNLARRSMLSQGDEKAAFRDSSRNITSAQMSRISEREERKGLQLAPAVDEIDESEVSQSRDNSAGQNDDIEALEAQAGVAVLLPGAFAVDGTDPAGLNSGYDSCFEDDSDVDNDPDVENPTRSQSMLRLAPPVADGQESVASDEDGGSNPRVSPLRAELHDRVVVEGQVVTTGDHKEPKSKKKCLRKILFWGGILTVIAIVGSTLLGIYLPKGVDAENETQSNISIVGWEQSGITLMGPTDEDLVQFGFDVSLSGDGKRMAVGAPGVDGNARVLDIGNVAILDFNGTDWNQVGVIEGSAGLAQAGRVVSLSKDGKKVVVSSPFANTGEVAVYNESSDGLWSIVGGPILPPTDVVNSRFGSAVALSGDGKVVAVGEAFHNIFERHARAGRVVVYAEVNSELVQIGQEILGEAENDHLGTSVALSSDGRRLAIGAAGALDFSGSLLVFDYDGETWNQVGSTVYGTQAMERMGTSVDISDDGNVVAAGAPEYASDSDTARLGMVQVFTLNNEMNDWELLGQQLIGKSKFDTFGNAVALSSTGLTIAVGSPESDKFGENNGQIQVFTYSDPQWTQVGSGVGSTNSSGAQYGFSVAISDDGNIIAGGAPFANYDGFRNSVGEVLTFARADL